MPFTREEVCDGDGGQLDTVLMLLLFLLPFQIIISLPSRRDAHDVVLRVPVMAGEEGGERGDGEKSGTGGISYSHRDTQGPSGIILAAETPRYFKE